MRWISAAASAVLVLAGWAGVCTGSAQAGPSSVPGYLGLQLGGVALIAVGCAGLSRAVWTGDSHLVLLVEWRRRWPGAVGIPVWLMFSATQVGAVLNPAPASPWITAIRIVGAAASLAVVPLNVRSMILLIADAHGLRFPAERGFGFTRVSWRDIATLAVDENRNPNAVELTVHLRPDSPFPQPALRVNDLKIDLPLRFSVPRAEFHAADLRRLLSRVDGPDLESAPPTTV